jgi:hypothetical protein
VLVGLYSVLSKMVVAEGQPVIVLDVVIGIGLALLGGRYLAKILFKTSP